MPVPLMMPEIPVISLPARASRRVLITGIPPATAASKRRDTPCASASAASSLPHSAISALLAVTTCLPAVSALVTRSLAVVVPPMSSTTTSTAGSSTTAARSLLTRYAEVSQLGLSRLAPMWISDTSAPQRLEIRPWWSLKMLTTPLATVPKPQIPIRSVSLAITPISSIPKDPAGALS